MFDQGRHYIIVRHKAAEMIQLKADERRTGFCLFPNAIMTPVYAYDINEVHPC
jgi:hypothetical protein